MSWTTPKTWAYKETLSSSDMNVYVRDNLNALRDGTGLAAGAISQYDAAIDKGSGDTNNTTTYANITDSVVTLTTTGGACIVLAEAGARMSAGDKFWQLRLTIDGVAVTGDSRLIGSSTTNMRGWRSLLYISEPAAGAHTWRLQFASADTTQASLESSTLIVIELKK